MRLPEAIAAARALTERLHEALSASDLDAAGSLLAARAEAMTDFENTHRAVNIGLINEMAQLADALDGAQDR